MGVSTVLRSRCRCDASRVSKKIAYGGAACVLDKHEDAIIWSKTNIDNSIDA